MRSVVCSAEWFQFLCPNRSKVVDFSKVPDVGVVPGFQKRKRFPVSMQVERVSHRRDDSSLMTIAISAVLYSTYQYLTKA